MSAKIPKNKTTIELTKKKTKAVLICEGENLKKGDRRSFRQDVNKESMLLLQKIL